MQSGTLTVSTSRQMEFVDITDHIQQAVNSSGTASGICCLFNPHTTAGITINEGCDPAVQHDILAVFKKIVPQSGQYPYLHAEGNSPAHILTTITGSSLSLIINNNSLVLGTWQRIFFCEYDGPRSRKLHWKILQG